MSSTGLWRPQPRRCEPRAWNLPGVEAAQSWTDDRMIRLLLVDDHAIVREGLRMLLGEVPDLDLVGEAADGPGAVRTAAALLPDVILLDLMLPGMNRIEVTRRILAQQPACRIIVLTSLPDDQN